MVAINLELPCPKTTHGVTVDPKPDWSFGDLLSELSSFEWNLKSRSLVPQSLPKANNLCGSSPIKRRGGNNRGKSLVMRATENVPGDFNDDKAEQNETSNATLVSKTQFHCHDIYFSDSDCSEDEFALDAKCPMIEKVRVVEATLHELTHHYQLCSQDEIRNKISALEVELLYESDKLAFALAQLGKNAEVRRETNKKLDMQYQHRIAEALDDFLTVVQRDHEHKCQIEEKRIKDDAAAEEARRKEKAQQERKLLEQKFKEEEKARIEAVRRADELRQAALKTERKATNEVAEKMVIENAIMNSTSEVATISVRTGSNMSGSGGLKKGSLVRAAENALNLEQRRLKMYEEFDDRKKTLVSSSNKDFSSHERQVALQIKQISGSVDNARAKASELVRIFGDPACPQAVSMMTFAKKVISRFGNPDANLNTSAFACGYVVALVSAQLPHVMDLTIAEFHKACIYAVPKHIMYSKSAFETKDAYLKAIGYQEEDGKIEARDHYLIRLRCYMKFYGALVQTQINGVRNVHGLEEGWAWLARFVNTLPANIYTAVALEAFLGMAGFALHRKYKSQFKKLLMAVSQHYLNALEARGEPELNSVIRSLRQYVEDKKFLVEPEGSHLPGSLLSRSFEHDQGHQEQNYHR